MIRLNRPQFGLSTLVWSVVAAAALFAVYRVDFGAGLFFDEPGKVVAASRVNQVRRRPNEAFRERLVWTVFPPSPPRRPTFLGVDTDIRNAQGLAPRQVARRNGSRLILRDALGIGQSERQRIARAAWRLLGRRRLAVQIGLSATVRTRAALGPHRLSRCCRPAVTPASRTPIFT